MLNKNEIQKVFDRLPKDKVELEKVELGLVDDAKAAIKELQKIEKLKLDATKSATNAKKILVALDKELMAARRDLEFVIDYKRFISPSKAFIKNGKKILNGLKKSAQELGVTPNKIKEYADLDNDIGLAEYDLEQVEKVIDFAKDTLKRYG